MLPPHVQRQIAEMEAEKKRAKDEKKQAKKQGKRAPSPTFDPKKEEDLDKAAAELAMKLAARMDMGEWKPDKTSKLGYHTIYSWIIPADIDGQWQWAVDGETVYLNLQQTFQKIDDVLIQAESDWIADNINIRGDRLTLIVSKNENESRAIYNGRVSGDSITGTVQLFDGENVQTKEWKAERK